MVWPKTSTRKYVITLAKIVRQIDALSAVIQAVSKATGCKVYSDEVLEKFKKPCFFVSASSRMTPYTDNVVEKELTIALTYFPRDNEKNEITYLGIIDFIQRLFQSGVQVGDRYLHVESVEDDRTGEEQDILQVTIVIPFLEQVEKPADGKVEIMGEVELNIHTISNKRRSTAEDEKWNSKIESETI